MSSDGRWEVGLRGVEETELRVLLRALESGHIGAPLEKTQLLAAGLTEETYAILVSLLAPLDAVGTATVLRLVLAERAAPGAPELELVWTGPEPAAAESRKTSVVVRRLFEEARFSVLIGGYAFDRGAELLEPLYHAMRDRRVSATLFLDIPGEAASEAETQIYAAKQIDKFLAENWPFGPPLPTIYYDPRTVSATKRASLHAKCAVVDDAKALITSANFTQRGQERNIEVGVLIHDATFATRLANHWRGLVARELVWVYGS